MKMMPMKDFVNILMITDAYKRNDEISIHDLESVFEKYGDEYFIGETSGKFELCDANNERINLIRPLCCCCKLKKGTHGITIRKPITKEMLLNHDIDNMIMKWYCDECFKKVTYEQKVTK